MTQTPAQRLRAARNKVIPPEIEPGCILRKKRAIQRRCGLGTRSYRYFIITKIRTKVAYGMYNIDFLLAPIDREYGQNVLNETLCHFLDEEEIKDNYEVLGKYTSLTDLMRMLEFIDDEYIVRTDGAISQFDFPEIGGFIVQLDFSRGDNMELQDPEVLEKLLSIIE